MNFPDITSVLVAIVGSGALTTILHAYINRHRNRAEVKQLYAEADQLRSDAEASVAHEALGLVKALQDELSRLRTECQVVLDERDTCRRELVALRTRVDLLENIIAEMRIENTVAEMRVDNAISEMRKD